MLLVTILGTLEMNKLVGVKKKQRPVALSIGTVIVFGLIALHATSLIPTKYLILLILPIFFPFLESLFTTKNSFNEIVPAYFGSIFLVAIPSSLTLYFFNSEIIGETAGSYLLLSVIGMIWVNDIFAYLVGSMFGKHRLYERISPKKSWEGSIGGLLFTVFGAFLYANISGLLTINQSIIMATIVVVFGSLGDLIESMLKRQAGVKDSGNIIPGHGGILDRFDATFFAIPFVFVYLIISQ